MRQKGLMASWMIQVWFLGPKAFIVPFIVGKIFMDGPFMVAYECLDPRVIFSNDSHPCTADSSQRENKKKPSVGTFP